MRRTAYRHSTTRSWTRRTLLASGGATALVLATAAGRAAAVATGQDGATTAGYAHPDWLVEPGWLMDRRADPAVKVVGLTPAEEFATGHIPGAAQVDWPAFELLDTSDPAIADWQGDVEATLTRLGLSPTDTAVVYDGGTLFAARLWWILDQLGHADKRILNGGLAAWGAAGGEIATGDPTAAPAAEPYAGTPDETALAQLDEVLTDLDDPGVVFVDARNAEEFAAGHIPGAVSVDFPLNAEPEPPKTWKPAAELRAMYADLGVTPDKRVVTYCATGVRSSVSYFTLRLVGYEDVGVFTGSWKEWSANPDLPVETGDGA